MIRPRIAQWWYAARESLWLLPGALTLAGALLALVMVQVDHALGLDQRSGRLWAFGGGAEGARGVLQAISGSLITVTATVFSITIVTLQLASTQFTPRVLGAFTRDRGVQLVFGVFIGTFTYSILVLRAVRSQQDDFERFVPAVSVVVAILLALVCVGFLIYIIHHVAQMIRVPAVVARVVQDGERLIAQRFPANIGDPVPNEQVGASYPDMTPAIVTATKSGYLQSLAVGDLFAIADDAPVTIRIERTIGAFVLPGEPLATMWPAARSTQEAVETIRRCCLFGAERTLEADIELPIRQLADIAIKALSPGINDPTTATMCIDRLAQLMLGVARRGDPPPAYRRTDSTVQLIVPAPTFEALAETAFGQIRHFGASDPQVGLHLLAILERLAALAAADHQTVLRRHAEVTRVALGAASGPSGR